MSVIGIFRQQSAARWRSPLVSPIGLERLQRCPMMLEYPHNNWRVMILSMISLSIALLFGFLVLAVIWILVGWNARVACRKPGWTISFTPNGVSFEPRHDRYQKVAEVITTLSSASLVFIPGSKLAAHPHLSSFALVLLGFSVLYCVLFMALLTFFYEKFLYDQYSYRPWKYGLVNALGFGGLLCFAIAYAALAIGAGLAATS
jgi:hypothetical protein